MNRTLIALAVGAAFAAPAAYADVTLERKHQRRPGLRQKSVTAARTPATASGTATTGGGALSRTGINTNYSNVTIASMEDLGGGLKLDFAYQLTANFENTANAATNRNSHIGLVGDTWGGVWIGTNENLYERYYYTVDPLDGAAGIGGNLSILGTPGYGRVFEAGQGPRNGVDFYRRTDHTVWYDSPNWGGFTFGAYTTLSAYQNRRPETGNEQPAVWGLGGKYVGPTIPIQVWAAYERHNDLFGLNVITGTASGHSSKDSGIQVGVGYTLGDMFIFANFERLKYETDGLCGAAIDEYRRNAWSVGTKWNVPTGYVGAQYMQAYERQVRAGRRLGSAMRSKTGCKSIGAGYYHTLSKQTQAYVMGQYISNDDLNFYTVAGGVGYPVNLGANVCARSRSA